MPKKHHSIRRKTKRTSLSRAWVFGILALLSIGVLTVLHGTPPKALVASCANSISCIKDLSGKPQTSTQGIFMGKKVAAPLIVAQTDTMPNVLGAQTDNSKKHIYVDLSSQHLYAYDDGILDMDFPISSGKWYPTPAGEFTIWIKLRSTRMAGGNPAIGTYYNLPNVEYTMYFYNNEVPKTQGFGLHGAYWHNNFGHPMSHGCINISNENAKKLFDWAGPVTEGFTTYATDNNPGTPLTVYGITPTE